MDFLYVITNYKVRVLQYSLRVPSLWGTVCCSVSQCVAVCCSVLQWGEAQRVAVWQYIFVTCAILVQIWWYINHTRRVLQSSSHALFLLAYFYRHTRIEFRGCMYSRLDLYSKIFKCSVQHKRTSSRVFMYAVYTSTILHSQICEWI